MSALRPATYQTLFPNRPATVTTTAPPHFNTLPPGVPQPLPGQSIQEWWDSLTREQQAAVIDFWIGNGTLDPNEATDTVKDVAESILPAIGEWILRAGAIIAGIALVVVAVVMLYKGGGK